MRLADPAPADPVLLPHAGHERLRGWGGGPSVRAEVVHAGDVTAAQDALARERISKSRGAIARGLGRSYGDAAQLANGLVLDTTPMDAFRLNAAEGTLTAQAGATLKQLLEALVPRGWILPVVPGTQHVTVGGAIASDIHGKNHRAVGTFGSHVERLGLLCASGEVVSLTRGDELLDATVGGMGLTGLIVWATISLIPVASDRVLVDVDRVESIDDAFEILAGPGGPHRVAWLDLLAPRPRGVVTRAENAPRSMHGDGSLATVRSRARVPSRWPSGLLRASTVRAYNELRYRTTPRRERGREEPFGAHMFPLDALDDWFRLYGPAGFLQYQLVVPTGAERVIHAVVEKLRRSRVPCYLAVLKDFGEASGAPLSFPLAGWTLALDIPRAAAGFAELLRSFDELVAEAGGRVYLSKDARLEPWALEAMYPRLAEWRRIRDGADPERLWRSDLAVRTGLVGARE